jgi:hypothetical protein
VPAAGGDVTLINPAGTRDGMHFTTDSTRIFAYSPVEGLVSFRWDGTDVKQHLRVVGAPPPMGGSPHEDDDYIYLPRRLAPMRADVLTAQPGGNTDLEQGPQAPPAGIILMAPQGDGHSQVGNDVYTIRSPSPGPATPR